MNNPQLDKLINKYRRKYKYLKKNIKSLMLENAALCDEVAKIQENISIAKEERKYLLRKVMEHEAEKEPRSTPTSLQNGSTAKVKKRKSPESSRDPPPAFVIPKGGKLSNHSAT